MDELEDSKRTEQIYIYIFTAMEAEIEGWDPLKDSLSPLPPLPRPHMHTDTRAPPSNSLLIIPRRYLHFVTLCMFKKIIQFISLGNRVATIMGKKVASSACHLFILWLLNCICLSLPLVLGVRCGFDCISS